MKFTKRIISLLLVIACLFATIPAVGVQASDDFPSEFYLTQTRRGTCTLCSAAMLLRACMYYRGNQDWDQITENGIRPVAWLEGAGLYWNFTYTLGNTSITVDHEYLSGISVNGLKSLLDTYPDGLVLYCGNLPHAVYLIDYVGDTFYCAETIENYSGKRITLAESWLGKQYGSQAEVLNNVTAYWYVKSSNVEKDCGCSNTYAGTYVCATSKSDLTIRSGHGTDYSAIGSIPTGAEVYVTRASGETDSAWAHVQYGGVSGYASMKYLKLKSGVALRGSGTSLTLSMDSEKTGQLEFWVSGDYTNPVSFSWSRDNTNISCGWGDVVSGKYPLNITANKPGTTEITITASDSQTGEILDSITVKVTVGSKSYTISYNSNGGSAAPDSQIKLNSRGLTLSDAVPNRLGYTFMGWSLDRNATKPDYLPGAGYFVNQDATLYAVWRQAITIVLDGTECSYNASIGFADGHQSYRFTPASTGEYTFTSNGDLDTKLWIYRSDGTLVGSDNNSGIADNFLLTTELTGGTTYYLRIKSTKTGAVNFTVAKDMPYIVGQSADVTVEVGQIAYVTVAASGQDLSYEWYYRNEGADRFVIDAAFTSNSYQVKMNDAVNGRQVYCVVKDKYGNRVNSDTVTVRKVPSSVCRHTEHTTAGVCTNCELAVEHSYADCRCTVCGIGENADQIKWQITRGTTSDSAMTSLRLISYVDSLESYSKVVFTLSYIDSNGVERTASFSGSSAYEKLLANGNAVTPGRLFGSDANYFVTFIITNLPNAQFDTEFRLTVDRYDLSGNHHSGATRFIRISDNF